MKRSALNAPLEKSVFDRDANIAEAMYGLPLNVEFCSSCGVSNQRPNSAVEFAHTLHPRNRQSSSMKIRCVTPVKLRNEKALKSTGKKEKGNSKTCAISSGAETGLMTALFQGREVRTVSFNLGS